MNQETYETEVAKSQQMTKFVLSLIREYFEPSSESSFLETSREVSKYMRKIGKDQLATYIDCLNGDEHDVYVSHNFNHLINKS